MGFDQHLFISYAHIDNAPLSADQQGWVSRFAASLQAILSMRLGQKAKIWRDSKLSGNDVFSDEIVRQFPVTAVMVSILSPRYINSDWCTKEVREFCDAASQTGGIVLDNNKSRVVKVIKTPVDNEASLPPVMKEMLGYPFYIVDEGQTPIELDPAYGADIAQKYNLKIATLAWDIAQVVKQLIAVAPAGVPVNAGPGPATAGPAKPVVYLAESAYELREAREAIASELRLQGYTVLPDRQLPSDEAAYVQEVRRLLDACTLSIHLVGSAAGSVPDGPSRKSVLVLQNEVATAKSRTAGLRRLIWLPENTKSANPDVQSFIDALKGDEAAQFGADLITANLETFKSAVWAALDKLKQPLSTPTVERAADNTSRLIYLICDERDRKGTVPLRKYLKSKGFDAELPLFQGEAAAVRVANQDLLAQCDAVLLYYGSGDEAWRRAVESDIRKAKGSRTDRPLVAEHTYLAEPTTADKSDLIDVEESGLINGLQGLNESGLEGFIEAVRGKPC